jgi:vacuolar protein sorting-associated protein 52
LQSSAARSDVQPELGRLRAKAVAKAREYLMSRIYALRKPKTNIQILQQNMLLRFRYLVTFLRTHGPEVFGEVGA